MGYHMNKKGYPHMKFLTYDQPTEILKAQATLFYWVQVEHNHFVNVGIANISSIRLDEYRDVWYMCSRDDNPYYIDPSLFKNFLLSVNFFEHFQAPQNNGNQEKYNMIPRKVYTPK